jgi:hypothetical protein
MCAELLTVAAACSNKSPTDPGSTNSGANSSGSCRTYATRTDITTKSLSFTLDASQTAAFDTSKKTYTVMEKFANNWCRGIDPADRHPLHPRNA